MGSMSAVHWLIVLIVVLLVFGPKRLAGLGKGVGEGIRGLREGLASDGEGAGTDAEKRIDKDKAAPPADHTSSSS
jgi:sec-independent protein translocase protein TatA